MIENQWYVLLYRNGDQVTAVAKTTPIYLEFFEEFIESIIDRPMAYKMAWNISNHEGGAMWFKDLQRHLEDAACSLIDSPCIGRTHGMIASPVVFTGIKDDDGKVHLLEREVAHQLADQLKRNSPICVEGDLILSTNTLLSKIER